MTQATSPCDTKAFIPHASVFVSANAGAGKTSLLTKRVLSLLLSGVEPTKILCLTFTKAAAAEMASRVQKELGRWVMLEEKKLVEALMELIGTAPDRHRIAYARSLFAKVLEAPEGVRIQTIHGFCQSLLRRFPIEAGISPHFVVMDTRTEEEMLHEARMRLFSRAQEWDVDLQQAIDILAQEAGETTLHDLLSEIIKNKRKFFRLVQTNHHLADTLDNTWKLSGLLHDVSEAALIHEHFNYHDTTIALLRQITDLLLQGSKTDKRTGEGLANWLSQTERTAEAADNYRNTYFSVKGKPYDKIFTQGSLKDPALIEILNTEFSNVIAFDEKWRSLMIARRSNALLIVAHALLGLYQSLKHNNARMDYDDLILTATALLERPHFSQWVLYKLDGGIDHILVDEAQDTSPEQWNIVQRLTEEFFAGEGRQQADRSLFVVGDEKQSIYRFQGADVSALKEKQDYFIDRIESSGNTSHRQFLIKSFRSLPVILKVVDKVFMQPIPRNGIMQEDNPLAHMAQREEAEGLMELWPLISKEEGQTFSPSSLMIHQITNQIESWLKKGAILESKGRPIEAGDIMILVRTRTDFVDRLSRSLKRRDIPVAGIDRMILSKNLAVQDLIALGQFLLLPNDDLTLASLLRSPIGNLSEEALFTLAYGRNGESLWKHLEQRAQEKNFIEVYKLLKELRARADYVSPYELYVYLLDVAGIRRKFLGRMGLEYNDPIDEFLAQALLYEQSHTASMQGFIYWMQNSDSEIKRDMEEAKGAVRIMTVHGAKGLQAPIVILPDTTDCPSIKDKLLWHKQSGMPLWPKKLEEYNAFCTKMREEEEAALYAEYCRQLYVAMTRAEDYLFVCGNTAKNLKEGSWYDLIKQGLSGIATPYDTEHGTGLRVGKALSFGQSKAVGKPVELLEMQYAGNLAFVQRELPLEPSPSQPLTPSKMADDNPPLLSPLEKRMVYNRGKLIHALLQHLPSYPENDHARIAAHIAAGYKTSMEQPALEQCIKEALAVLADKKYRFLFQEGLAEVPITGVVQIAGKPYMISGQLDRLHVGMQEVWVVDYKTARAAPLNVQDTPAPYLRQMALYRQLLTSMYPDKTIYCGLLWTAEPVLTQIPDALLDEAAFASYI